MNKEILSEKQVNALIKQRNARFKGKTKSEKRVLIAKDVIAQIKNGKFTSECGTWVSSETLDDIRHEPYFKDEGIQKLMLSNKVDDCVCCALGAIMLSCVLFKNKVKVRDYWEEFEYPVDNIENKTSKSGFHNIFSLKQSFMIESAFELGSNLNGKGVVSSKLKDDCLRFGYDYETPEKRLVAIMQNIIKNKGEFIP